MCIKNINVFTGDADQEILKSTDILIKDGRIEKIGTFSPPETGCRIIDGTGKMAIPGLIDHHIHINAPGAPPWFPVLPNRNLVDRNLSAFLYAGVTTVFDMGGPSGGISYRIGIRSADRIERRGPLFLPCAIPVLGFRLDHCRHEGKTGGDYTHTGGI